MKTKFSLALILVACVTALGCMQGEVTAPERDMFVRGHDFADDIEMTIEQTVEHETFTKTKFFDGSVQIEYEFEPPENFGIYLTETISFEPKKSEAKTMRSLEDSTVGLALRAYGLEKVEIPDFYKYGDSSIFYALKKDGRTVGNYFTVVENGKVFSLMIAGVFIDDPDVWREIVEPKLKLFSAYKPN